MPNSIAAGAVSLMIHLPYVAHTYPAKHMLQTPVTPNMICPTCFWFSACAAYLSYGEGGSTTTGVYDDLIFNLSKKRGGEGRIVFA